MVPAVCSHCGAQHEVSAYPSINTAQEPDLKARVLDGSLFVWECPYCGVRNLVKYETLYHDPDGKLMVWLLPEGKMPPKAVEDAVKALDGYTLRRVGEVGELIEKVKIHEAGLDDWTMELCKWVTRQELSAKNPEMAGAPLRFHRLEGADHSLVFVFPLNGSMNEVSVGFNVYEDASGILRRNPQAGVESGFAVVDADRVLQFFR